MFSPIFLFPFIIFCIFNVSSSIPRLALSSEKLQDSKYEDDFKALNAHKKLQQQDSAASDEEEEMETKVSEMRKSIKIAKEYELQLSKALDKCQMQPLRKPITSLDAYQIAALSLHGIQELIAGALDKIGIDVDKESVKCASKAVAAYKKVIVAKYELSAEERSERKHSLKQLF